jgi:hypothetical protein
MFRLIKSLQIRSLKVGGRRLVPVDAIREFLASG